MGGLIKFPRDVAGRGDPRWSEWSERESAPMATRADGGASLIRWIDVARQREGEDDGDGGGAAA
jgi:hypothetical protein